jgi:hypothetical protein
MLVDNIVAHTIRRSNVVINGKVRQGSPKIVKETLVSVRDRNACRTSFPNPHQPHSIEAVCGDSIPLDGGNRRQGNFLPVLLAQL